MTPPQTPRVSREELDAGFDQVVDRLLKARQAGRKVEVRGADFKVGVRASDPKDYPTRLVRRTVAHLDPIPEKVARELIPEYVLLLETRLGGSGALGRTDVAELVLMLEGFAAAVVRVAQTELHNHMAIDVATTLAPRLQKETTDG